MPPEISLDRRLRLRDLRLLQEVARLGSMAKAARELGITQPAVSKALSDLERLLGVRLLDRGSGGVVPTSYGDALLRHAKVMFDELRRVSLDLAHLADPSVGALRIACPEFVAAGILHRSSGSRDGSRGSSSMWCRRRISRPNSACCATAKSI